MIKRGSLCLLSLLCLEFSDICHLLLLKIKIVKASRGSSLVSFLGYLGRSLRGLCHRIKRVAQNVGNFLLMECGFAHIAVMNLWVRNK